jgi:hypothetical protein
MRGEVSEMAIDREAIRTNNTTAAARSLIGRLGTEQVYILCA